MRALDLKLLRNFGSMKGQVVAIVLIIACGVASFVTVITAYRSLKASRDTYYRRYRMADVFAYAKRAPRSVLRSLEDVPGVKRVAGRVVFDVTIDLPRLAQPASGRVLSVPDRRDRIINDLHLTQGDWFTGDGTREVIVADGFAEVHGLEVGDRLRVLMNNKKQALRIVGRALSPEFVYLIRGGGELLPDPEHFTVLWMSESFAEAIFDFEDACNDIVATLGRGARVEDVIDEFDRRLDRYGGVGAYARADQASHRFLSDEIKGLEASATMMPALFLAVAAAVLHVLMSRLVRTQRVQISIFRAFGYSTLDLARHYLLFALVVGLLGAVLGTALGLVFARAVLQTYKEFFSFPVLAFGVDPVAVPLGFVISLGFAAIGALSAMRTAVRLQPAEGLRSEAPATYRPTLLERVPFLWRRLGFVSRMTLRRLARTKIRSAVATLGVVLSMSIVQLTFFAFDANDTLMDSQFRLVERQDAYVAFHRERGREALYELRRLEGVRRVEPELIAAVELVNGWRSRRTAITGILPDRTLLGLLDADQRHVELPEDGLLLSTKLADILGVRVGETVEARMLTGRKRTFRVPVASVVDEYLGVGAYANLDTLGRWIDEPDTVTSARLSVDPEHAEALGRRLKDLPAVSAVTFKAQLVKVWRDTIQESQSISLQILLLFAGAIIFGVLYNTARISLAERHRELGALRVLGYTHRETAGLLAAENLVLVGLALAPGVALGVFFSWALSVSYDTDLFRFPFVVEPDSVFWTIVVTLVFALLANLAVMRHLRRLDLVEVLKARE